MQEKYPALSLKNVSVAFNQEFILEHVNFDIHHGETILVVGPSGGGKTVLLKTMAGVYKPTTGQVTCEGEDWQNLQSDEKRKLAEKIGVQFQKSALFDSLDVFENVAFPIREHHPEYTEQWINDRVEFCLKSVNLWDAKNLMPHEISGGMKQRLSIARAISLNPEILFYDDPTAGLDPLNTDQMLQLILQLKKQNNSTLIIVTHDMNIAYQLAGRIFLVANKEVIETGNALTTKNHPDPRVQQFIHGKQSGPLQWS